MKLLFLGDVVGKSGRNVVREQLPPLRTQLKPDFVIINGENASGGNGINQRDCNLLLESGADIITSGNHIWDRNETLPLLDSKIPLLRPHNFPDDAPGSGIKVIESAKGYKLLVMNLQAQLYMSHTLDDPFKAASSILKNYILKRNIDAIFIDFHGEASSEKMAMGHFLDGRVSMVVGTHTHIPTADHQILPKGTAYQTDAGMCGDYHSVIGFHPDVAVKRFIDKRKVYERPSVANGPATMCGTFVKINDKTGLATSIEPIRVGGTLAESLPI
ncbi:MAG: TIGR00282 family metallophosphoesterase [Rickettsiales bacterium]|nr:TIGR00282 family metallophosphoesterase [Rickettsiales bacterium]